MEPGQDDSALTAAAPNAPAPDVAQPGQVISMVLISEAQRAALIVYLSKQPYQDVAAGITFLRDAPTVNVNLAMLGSQATEEGDPD